MSTPEKKGNEVENCVMDKFIGRRLQPGTSQPSQKNCPKVPPANVNLNLTDINLTTTYWKESIKCSISEAGSVVAVNKIRVLLVKKTRVMDFWWTTWIGC